MSRILKIIILIGMLLSSMMFSQAQGATPQYILDAARNTAEADLPDLGAAVGWSHVILNNINDTSLGCVLVTGVTLPSPIDVYRLELTYGESVYSVYISSDATMVQLCDERFPGMRAGVVGANDTSPTGCFLYFRQGPGTIANVRTGPSTNSKQVAHIFLIANQSYAVLGIDASTEWFLFVRVYEADLPEQFWVNRTGLELSGDCSNLPTVDPQFAGSGSVCPPEYNGYLPPRITLGTANARITAGSYREPTNLLRGSPFVNSVPIGEIQHSDTLSIRGGPACNEGYVWWMVQVRFLNGMADSRTRQGHQSGWTVESDINSNAYYIEPIDSAGNTLDQATPPTSVSQSPPGCFLRSSGIFANVRNGPSTNSKQVVQIFPNQSYAVLGIDASTEWFFFNQGWVNRTVLELSGDCSNLPTLDPQFAGSGSVFFCPPEYNGYLPPRITLGTANARITPDTLPNRLRAEPTVNSAQIGEIQPSRTLDAILEGPACNEGYVWWQVNIDNTIGWTVESDINSNAYYIEPIDSAGNTLDQATPPTPVSQSPPPSDTVNPSTFQMITSANSMNVDTLTTLQTPSPYIVAWSPSQSVLAAISITGEIDFYSYPTFDNVNALYNLPDTLQPSAVAFSADDRFLAIGNMDGQVYVVEIEDGGFISGNYLPQSHTSPVRALAWSHEGYNLASVSGFSEVPITGAEWTFKVWDISTGNQSPPNLFINYAFPYPLSDVAFSSDGNWIAVTGESPADQQAAIWIYNTSDTQLYFSKGLVYMQGFSFVTETPDPALGDFVYNNGDTAYRIIVATEEDVSLYSESGMLINEIAFRSQVITGAEVFFAVTNRARGIFSGEETLTFVNALNTASPSSSLTVSTTDIAFSPDGRVLAVTDVVNGRLLILGVVDR